MVAAGVVSQFDIGTLVPPLKCCETGRMGMVLLWIVWLAIPVGIVALLVLTAMYLLRRNN
jgi:hypothetical protein